MKDEQEQQVEAADPLWADLAACRGVDTELFFSDSKADQEYVIKTYCNKCPVIDNCEQSATKADKIYSVRGGSLAGWGVRSRNRKRPPRKPPVARGTTLKVVCPRGHPTPDNTYRDHKGQCKECVRIRCKLKRDEARALKYGQPCKAGLHVLGPGNITPRGACDECQKIRKIKRGEAPAVDLTNESSAA